MLPPFPSCEDVPATGVPFPSWPCLPLRITVLQIQQPCCPMKEQRSNSDLPIMQIVHDTSQVVCPWWCFLNCPFLRTGNFPFEMTEWACVNIMSKCMISTWTPMVGFHHEFPILCSGIVSQTGPANMGSRLRGVSPERGLPQIDPIILAVFFFCPCYRLINWHSFLYFFRCQELWRPLILILKQKKKASIINTLQTPTLRPVVPPVLSAQHFWKPALPSPPLRGASQISVPDFLVPLHVLFLYLVPHSPLTVKHCSFFNTWFCICTGAFPDPFPLTPSLVLPAFISPQAFNTMTNGLYVLAPSPPQRIHIHTQDFCSCGSMKIHLKWA